MAEDMTRASCMLQRALNRRDDARKLIAKGIRDVIRERREARAHVRAAADQLGVIIK